jgi:hypothetical protein
MKPIACVCGSKARLSHMYAHYWVECTREGCHRMTHPYHQDRHSERKAIIDWNKGKVMR